MGSVLSDIKNTYEVENQILFQAVNELKNGDEQAFDKVYKMSEKYIYSIINRITHDNEKTADLMQETYIQVYKKIDTLENAEAFLIWAGRIATNYTLRFIQKDSKEILSTEEDNDFIFERASDDKEEFLPEDILLNKEKKNKIHDIINSLSSEQKITVQYYYFADMSVSEIAEEMRCSTGTVKSRLNYARKNIKEIVLDTEKKEGIKLHSLSGLPLFLLLFREEVAYAAVPKMVSSSVAKGIADAVGVNITKSLGLQAVEVGKKGIKELLKGLLKTTGGKVISGVAITAVVGTVAVTQIPQKDNSTIVESEQNKVETVIAMTGIEQGFINKNISDKTKGDSVKELTLQERNTNQFYNDVPDLQLDTVKIDPYLVKFIDNHLLVEAFVMNGFEHSIYNIKIKELTILNEDDEIIAYNSDFDRLNDVVIEPFSYIKWTFEFYGDSIFKTDDEFNSIKISSRGIFEY